ncbi:MAG: response regulator [Patescibacteria group bacterium]
MKKILFIEDEPALQKAMGDFLKSQGYVVFSALNGPDGLELAKSQHPDLVLLDLILPGIPGLDLLERLRAREETKAIPVIVLTNVESSEAVERAVELGATTYMVKTNYSLDEVLEKVRAVLGE